MGLKQLIALDRLYVNRGCLQQALGQQLMLDSGVCHMAFFRDPAGNALMLHHRYAPRD